jgi:hypothetical protein
VEIEMKIYYSNPEIDCDWFYSEQKLISDIITDSEPDELKPGDEIYYFSAEAKYKKHSDFLPEIIEGMQLDAWDNFPEDCAQDYSDLIGGYDSELQTLLEEVIDDYFDKKGIKCSLFEVVNVKEITHTLTEDDFKS